MFRLPLSALLAVFSLLPYPCHAQRRVSLVGNVYFLDESHPAENVRISLNNAEEGHYEDGVTNGAGQFRFGNLKPSVYVLKIDQPAYEPVSETVDATLASDKDVKIYLRTTAREPVPAKGNTISAHELSVPEKAREFAESGRRKLYHDKNFTGALADFKQAISVAPGYYEAHYSAGMAYLAMDNPGEAETSFRKSRETSGDKYGEADVRLGAILLDQGNVLEAESLVRKGLQLNPAFWLGHYELGRTLLKEKRLAEAEISARQARMLAPAAPIVYRLLSNIHLAQKNYRALIEDLDAYLALDPGSPAGLRAREIRNELQRNPALTQVAPASAKP